ncbi:MAG TPA: hypothetical protein VKT33_05075 [Candidatus Angelobacter sp.]|nr:hypothetical protein [Candidatus Angelobacter sp.]
MLRKTILPVMAFLLVTSLWFSVTRGVFASSASQSPQFPPPSQMERDMEARRLKEANKQRQEEIKQNTLRLFQLATELKDAVDKTDENMLSLDVVKKADEVEKLAKKVKEKMKEGTPTSVPPQQRFPHPQDPRLP